MIYNSATKICLIMIVVSIIILNFMQIPVSDPLGNIAILVVWYYFYDKNKKISWNKE